MAYCTKADIDGIFGVSNVKTWSDIENKNSPQLIDARIASAIVESEDYINNFLRGGSYAIPFVTIPTTIKNVCAKLAGLWLYENRGVIETNPETGQAMHRYMYMKKSVKAILIGIKTGAIILDLTILAARHPQAVDTDADTTDTE
jgi:phage gp36-like protein